MASPWVGEEMQDVDLKDRRLNERSCEVLSQLGSHPTASIPAACGGHAEMTAAYRLFDNEKVDFDSVLRPHVAATRRRIAAEPVVIVVQDTTEIDLTRPDQQVLGVGPLDGGPRRGMFLHPLHAFAPDGTPLGTVSAKVWVRDNAPLLPAVQRAAKRKQTPIEEKESHRWIDMIRQAGEEARRSSATRFVAVADGEADIYELLAEAQADGHEVDWIVRACQDRAVEVGRGEATAPRVREQVLAQEVLFTHTIGVRGRTAKVQCEDRGRRQARQSRRAEVEVRAARVTLRAPNRPDRVLPEVAVNVVLVRETNPPRDEPAVEWVLPCLATYLIVAWRTLYVCRPGRALPDISCEAIFGPAEWKSLYRVVRRQPHPPCPPSLSEVVPMVAESGGYVSRKRDDMPGPQTVWLGLQRLHDITLCWKLFGPEATTEVAIV